MRLSNLIVKIEDATLRGTAKAKTFAAQFKEDLAEAKARRLARQMEEQSVVLFRAMEIMAQRNIDKS